MVPPMSNEDLEFYLGDFRNVLPGKTYEEKINYLTECIDFVSKKGYTICPGKIENQDDAKECRNVLTAAGAILEDNSLLEKVNTAEKQFNEMQKTRKQGRTIAEIVKEREELNL